jgi:hypothetical protein
MNQPQDLYQEVIAGGDIKSFLLNLHRRNTGELPTLDLPITDKMEAMPTIALPSFHRSNASIAPHRLYLDQYGRRCLRINGLIADTIDLASEAVHRFKNLTGQYPDEIIPCPSRFLLLRFGNFCPVSGILIPFSRDFVFPIDYDVIVRKQVL